MILVYIMYYKPHRKRNIKIFYIDTIRRAYRILFRFEKGWADELINIPIEHKISETLSYCIRFITAMPPTHKNHLS